MPEGDELVSTATVIEAIKSARDRYHILCLQHADLGDARTRTILRELRTPSTESEQDEDAAAGSIEREGQDATHGEWIRLLPPQHTVLKWWNSPNLHGIRTIQLGDNDLTSDCIPAICNLLAGNLTLYELDLRSNRIDNSNGALVNLAKAVGQSGLRCLSLSNNPICLESLAAFFDSIPANGTALERLQLSSLLADLTISAESLSRQAALAATSIGDFISDSRRCRSLSVLFLNGNNFGIRGLRIILSAVLGSGCCADESISREVPAMLAELRRETFFQTIFRARSRGPNSCLDILFLDGDLDLDGEWLTMDPQEDVERLATIKRRYASIPLQDIEAIVSFLRDRARKQRLQGNGDTDDEAPIEVARHLATLGVTMDEWQAEFQEAFLIVSVPNPKNWREVLKRHSWRKRLAGRQCLVAAEAVLAAARTLGCRARRRMDASMTEASGVSRASAGFPRFLDLPPELRLHVLRQLDDTAILSARQFSNVISFACEPSTIGYGETWYNWSNILDEGVDAIHDAEFSSSATLPARPWSWAECFALRAPPRDWEADELDANDDDWINRNQFTYRQASRWAFLESTQTHRVEPE